MFGATKRIAMLGQVPLLGQINSGFSWNTAPGGWNPYVPAVQAQIPNAFGGPSAQVPEAAPAGSCFTCTNPSTGDTKYGVPSAMANGLKSQGYRCRADECAGQPGGVSPMAFPGAMNYGGPAGTYQGAAQDFGGDQGGSFYGSMMEGARIPIQRGIGRRAFGGW